MRGKLGLVLKGKAILSKSLIQFSVDGWVWVPSLLFTWGQTMVEVVKIMVTSFKRAHTRTAVLNAPSPAAGHRQPALPPENPGHSQASLGQSLVGSLLLFPGSWYSKFLFVPFKSLFPQSYVSSGSSMVRLMGPLPRGLMPYPSLLHPEPLPQQQATPDPYFHRRHSNTALCQSLWGFWVLVHTRYV